MSEKLYKIVSGVGAGSIALGIITLVTGVTTGVLMIVNGARLLKGKSDMMIYGDCFEKGNENDDSPYGNRVVCSLCDPADLLSLLFRGVRQGCTGGTGVSV